jgi:hypothetical protein
VVSALSEEAAGLVIQVTEPSPASLYIDIAEFIALALRYLPMNRESLR